VVIFDEVSSISEEQFEFLQKIVISKDDIFLAINCNDGILEEQYEEHTP
jgi:hypothetical protein